MKKKTSILVSYIPSGGRHEALLKIPASFALTHLFWWPYWAPTIHTLYVSQQ